MRQLRFSYLVNKNDILFEYSIDDRV